MKLQRHWRAASIVLIGMYLFYQENDIDVIVESISDYINFCENNVIIEKTIKVFPNSKPWVGKELENILNEKR